MLKLNQLVIDAKATVGEHFRFLGYKPSYEYQNGAPTQRIKGYRAEIVMLDRGYATLYVTVPQEPNHLAFDSPVEVKDLVLKAYVISGKCRIVATATAIEPLTGE